MSPYSFNTTFGEIPWQAMILNDASKTILCGGVILDSKHVLTTAKCVQRYNLNWHGTVGQNQKFMSKNT